MLSVEMINYNLGKPIVHYSYPEGLEEHFNQEVIDTIKVFGIKCCPTAISGPNTILKDLFRLNREMV
ncbi:hypothetical protein LCGC14_1730790, partial [marine sediment metagenome]